jgi:hypothetical protein
MSTLIWLHEDCLRDGHNLFAQAPDSANRRAVFIWDDAHMTAMHYGLNRRVFIYETLCQLPVEIYVGDTVETLTQLADGAQTIITGKTPNPALKHIMQTLRQNRTVSAIADAPFVQMDSPPDLRRFFKYWNKAKKHAFLYDGRP